MEESTVFCTNCGARIKAGDKVCYNCGTPNESYRPDESPSAARVRKKPFKSLLIGLIAGGAAVIILVVILLLTLTGGYKAAVDRVIDLSVNPKVSTLKKMIPDDAVDYLVSEYYYGDEQAFWDYLEGEFPDSDELDDLNNYEFNIGSGEKLSPTKLKKLRDIYSKIFENYGMDIKKLTEAYTVQVEVTLEMEGWDEPYKTSTEFTAVKYDGDWFVLEFLEGLSSL